MARDQAQQMAESGQAGTVRLGHFTTTPQGSTTHPLSPIPQTSRLFSETDYSGPKIYILLPFPPHSIMSSKSKWSWSGTAHVQ